MTMADVVLEAEGVQKNFVANSLILLHNSEHVEFFVVDEVDVIPGGQVHAYRQAAAIPDSRDGLMPITLLTSTRKSRIGLVQKEIDEAPSSGLQLFHWNVIDVLEACPASRHRPDLPRGPYYVSDDAVRHISPADYALLNPTEARKWYLLEGFAGCAKCPLFPGCKGRLATHQTSRSPMLKPIIDISSKFKSNTPEFVTTEYLCRKPDTTGIVYPRLNPEVHMKTPMEMAAMVSGEVRPEVKDKASLIKFLLGQGVQFYAGMDFGFGHNFAVVVYGVWGNQAYVVECLAIPGLELDDKILHSEHLKTAYNNPAIYGDTASPDDIKTFKRKGFRMKDWKKGAGTVKGGIEVVRMLLQPAAGPPRLFFLAGDSGCEFLVAQMGKYHFVIGADGTVTEEPDKENDDECDALRYGIMNYFAPKGALRVSAGPPIPEPQSGVVQALQRLQPGKQADWMKDIVRQHVDSEDGPSEAPSTQCVKKGRFFFDQ